MTIKVDYAELSPSVFVHDESLDWSENIGNTEKIHLALRCRHENIGLDLETDNESMYCPDCNNKHLTEREELQYFLAYKDEGDLSNDEY